MVLATTPYYSSMLIVTQVAVDRFYTICKPIRHRATSSIRRSLKRVAVAWCCSLIYSTTLYLERILASKPCPAFVADPLQSSSGGRCDQMGALGQYSALSDVFKVLPFVFCLALNCLLYARIVKTLRDRFVLRIHRPGRQVPEWIRKIQQSRVQITKMLVVNSLVFFICNTPRCITLISGYIHDTLGVTRWDANENIEVFSGVLLVLNSCINPVIYNLTNKKYRRAFREVFLPCSSSTSSQRMPTVFHLQISSD
ncbi:neuromedin-U receptor 2-like [Acanthaster planci]|uniref:Neuromedin-U receptor 2-like n=1 Tax=Acanthaster planci TaxID=133434 RepID=A0A8B7ZJZ1_ACAPL|nr:neuromedin-U receptor 2-like [Acanthaster planci]